MTTDTNETSKPRYFGRSVKRREDPKYLMGQGRYTDDIHLANMLHAVILRSPYAHANIKHINSEEALKLPGVVAIFTGADLKHSVGNIPCNWVLPGMLVPAHPAFAYDKVRHVGDGVAIILAEEYSIACDALDLIQVEYEPLPAVVNQEQALQPGAPLVHDDVPNNRALEWRTGGGDFERAAAEADVHVKQRLINQQLIPHALETRAVLAHYNHVKQEFTLYSSTQSPHLVRRLLAEPVGFPEHKIRVIAPDIGGGFGSKLHFYAEEALCAFLARETGRPVKWVETRSENAAATTHGRGHIQDIEVTATRDGKLTGLKITSYANLGAYLSTMGPGIPTVNFGSMLSGTYTIPNLDCRVYGILTNTTPVDTYRGAGRPEASYLVERAVDLVAAKIGLDPVEVRRRNFIPADAFPYTTVTNVTYNSGNYELNMEKALAIVGYQELRRKQKELREQGRYLGIGISTYVEFCGLGPSWLLSFVGFDRGAWESATVRVHPSGKVTVFSGSSAHGQGHETSFAQIVADGLGLSIEDIEVVESDTAQVQFGKGTFNSRSMPVGGIALKRSVDKVVAKARRIAAHVLEAAEEDIEFHDGQFNVKGVPERAKQFAEISKAAYLGHNLPDDLEPGLEAQTFHDPQGFVYPFGTHIAVVEVDAETGEITLGRYVAVDDCGNIINPLLAAGQIHGGIAQGAGQALFEGVEYDEAGQFLTGTLMDYALPRAEDLPDLETAHTVTPSPVNPLGVKGIGESGTTGSTPAVVNAVIDALAPFGITHLDMPLKAEKVWQAIQNAKHA